MLDFDFIDISKIKILTLEVTEQINSKFINDFIKTSLQSHNIQLSNTTYLWYNFIKENSFYEVYIITDPSNTNIHIYPEIFLQHYDNANQINNTKTIDLFIYNNFFALYKYGKLYSFKIFQNSTLNDIKNYVLQIYQLNLDNIYQYSSEEFNQLYEQYCQNQKLLSINLFQPLTTLNNLKFINIITIITFTIVVFLGFTFYQQNKTAPPIKSTMNIQDINIAKNNIKQIYPKLVELFKYLKLEKLYINHIEYKNTILYLSLTHNNKKTLLNFLTIYPQKTSLKQLVFSKQTQTYTMVIEIEF